MKTPCPRLLALVLLCLISAGCNFAPRLITGPALLSETPALQPSPSVWHFPRGRFSAISTPNMVILTIENNGDFHVFVDNDLRDSGKFELSGAQVLVDSMTCAGKGDKPAWYYWRYGTEDGLAFRPVGSDPCPERRQYLSEEYQPKYMFVFNIPDRGFSRDWLW